MYTAKRKNIWFSTTTISEADMELEIYQYFDVLIVMFITVGIFAGGPPV